MLIKLNKENSPKMVKHISKVIKETELYKELQRRNMILKGLFQAVSVLEHKKSVKKTGLNE